MPPAHNDEPTRTATTPDVTTDHTPGSPSAVRETVDQSAPDRAEGFEASLSVPGYELLGVLGRGGMGVVYKARHVALKRTVALKVLQAGGFADPVAMARFRLEAEAVARLQHPNIVQVYEVGEANGLPCCALEYVEGGSLAERLNGRPVPPEEAARLVEVLAGGVQLAHSRNVVHRDLKPANVLLAADGTPKIADFGLARQLDTDSGTTQAGAVMGTPSYMAPEQAYGRSNEAGPAADVYALGAILYECLTGRPPFRGRTVVETLDMVRTRAVDPPSRVRAGVPADLETICLKCLSKESERRYASAAELADDLARYRNGEPIRARPAGRVERAVKWVRRNPVVSGAATAVLLALAVGATVSFLKYREAEEQRGIAESRRRDAEAKEAEARNEADKARKARDFLVSILQLSDEKGKGGAVTARQILEDAERRIPKEFADQPELRAELMSAVDTVFAKITAESPQAMILEARGSVTLHPARNPERKPVAHTLLYAGDRLVPAAGAEVQVVFVSDFHTERLKPTVEATVGRKGCAPAGAVAARGDDLVMTFVRMPKGTFYMGWEAGDSSTPAPGVKTEIKADYEIGVYPVTQGQWHAVTGRNPAFHTRYGMMGPKLADVSDEELKLFPIEFVSYADTEQFVAKLNERNRGRGWVYRLPTEAEWEYACRCGATTEADCSFNFYLDRPTNDLASTHANFHGGAPGGAAPKGPYLDRPSRVGAYPPNSIGLCDMHGNIAQWCDDRADPKRDPNARPLRGGSYPDPARVCHAGFRQAFTSSAMAVTGFRLVRVPER